MSREPATCNSRALNQNKIEDKDLKDSMSDEQANADGF